MLDWYFKKIIDVEMNPNDPEWGWFKAFLMTAFPILILVAVIYIGGAFIMFHFLKP